MGLEERESGHLIGHCGFMPIPLGLPVQADVEIGWRLSESWQGRGLAREAAEKALQYGFSVLGFDRVVAYSTPANEASWGLMARLGMARIGEFDYPMFPEGHPFRRQVLYEARGVSYLVGT